MTHINPDVMEVFEEELEKEALSLGPAVSGLLQRPIRHAVQQGVGTGLGVGALAGAALGGGSAARDAYRSANEQGAGKVRALLSGVGSGLAGAAKGVGTGAILGAGTGGLLGLSRPGATTSAAKALVGREGMFGAASRFGQRQVHGFVGGSTKALERARGGAYGARKALDTAFEKGSPKEIVQNAKWLGAAQRAENMGLTSLPGIAKAIPQHGLGKVLQTGAAEQWHSMSPSMKALMVGFPALSIGGAVARPEQPGGPGKAEQVGKSLGALGYTSMPLSLGASMALGAGLERVGGAAGRGIDRLRGRTPMPEPEPPHDPVPVSQNNYGMMEHA